MAVSQVVWGVVLTVAAVLANTLVMGRAVMGLNLGLVVALTSRPAEDT